MAATSSTSQAGPSQAPDEGKENEDSTFECNICLDTAKDAVVSMCGHLFCWPCLHQWLETKQNKQMCPVCKAAVSREKVIPIYGRGSTQQSDPRDKVPPRPAGQRTEPENNANFPGFGFGDGNFHMSFGIGAFPFAFLTSSFNIGATNERGGAHGGANVQDDRFLSQAFLWIALFFIFWLLIA